MSDEREWRVEIVVHGSVPASSAREALNKLCERIREGIGPEGDEGREWGVAIAAGRVERELFAMNEEWVRRQQP